MTISSRKCLGACQSAVVSCRLSVGGLRGRLLGAGDEEAVQHVANRELVGVASRVIGPAARMVLPAGMDVPDAAFSIEDPRHGGPLAFRARNPPALDELPVEVDADGECQAQVVRESCN